MEKELCQMTIHETRHLLDNGEICAMDLVSSVFKKIESLDPKINAYITTARDTAFKQAKEADKKIARGETDLLTGIPVAIKDALCTRDLRTTCASKTLENFIPPYDATVIEKIKNRGAVIIGKTNMDEFSMGSSNESSFFGTAANPWDMRRVPGGSSGGSAAATAADECIASLGSDTGGSIRQPASFCGVVGFKPTYGRVSRFGLVSYASSLDQVGTLTKDVEDAAILLDCISGFDPKDATSSKKKSPSCRSFLKKNISGLTLGIPAEYFPDTIDSEVKKAVFNAAEKMRVMGAEIKRISLPRTEYAVAAYYIIASAEAGSNLARYDGVKYGHRSSNHRDLKELYKKTRSESFGKEVKRRILLGTYVLSAGYYDDYYKKASQVRTLIFNDFKNAFKDCDLILTPTAPSAAFLAGEKTKDPLDMYLSDVFTIPASLAGIPAVSIPCGFTRKGLPLGIQLIGNSFEEEKIIGLTHAFEQSTSWHLKKPVLPD